MGKWFSFDGTISGLAFWFRTWVFGLGYELLPEYGTFESLYEPILFWGWLILHIWIMSAGTMKRARALEWNWSKGASVIYSSSWIFIIGIAVLGSEFVGLFLLLAWLITDLILIFRNSKITNHNG